jgi:tetratricopeptide (TPR) repeat protein
MSEGAAMDDEVPKGARCEAHGLAYDPTVHPGCVLCRREQAEAEPQQAEPPSRKAAAIVLSLSALVLACFTAGAYAYLQRQRAAIEADGPSEPDVDSVVAALPGVPDHRGTIMLGREGIDEYGYPNDLPDKLTLQSLLREKRFEELSSHIESFQAAFEQDFKKEKWLAVGIEAFHTADRQIGKLIDQWVKASPDSFAPYLARAAHKDALAWHYRGSHWARLTSNKRFAKMRKILLPALSDLERALELRPSLSEARSTQLDIAKDLGADLATKAEILEAGLRHCSSCFGIRAIYLQAIEPRWGGSHELMDQKAADWQLTDQNPRLKELLGFSDMDRCSLLISENEPEQALSYCDRALAHGQHVDFLSTKAAALARLERYDEAIELFSQALEILPQRVRSLSGRGHALLKAERYEEATRDLVLATRLDPVNSEVAKDLHYILAQLVRMAYYQAEAGEVEAAIATYDQVLTMHPRYPDAFAYRGHAYAKKGDLAQAEKDYLRAIQLDPTNVDAYRGLDQVLFQQDRLDEIVRHWNRYLKRKPRDATALLERGGAYHRKGERELAKQDVTKACRLGNEQACDAVRRFYPSP